MKIISYLPAFSAIFSTFSKAGQAEQDRQNGTGRTGQADQDRKNGTGRTRQCRIARADRTTRTRTGQPRQETKKGQPEQDGQKRTATIARTGKPE